MITGKRKISIMYVFKVAILAFAGFLSLLFICLAFTPALLSSHRVQALIQKTLTTSLKRHVDWSNLAMTWSDGLTLSGLKIGEGPAPLLKSDIDQIVISPGFGRGTDGRFGIDLVVKIKNVRAELAPGPPEPAPKPSDKDPLTLLAESIQKIQGLDFPLPVDLRVLVDVAPLQVAYLRPQPGKQLKLHDFSFHIAMPSLATKPVLAEVNGLVSVDGREMGKVSFNTKVDNLVTKDRRINLAVALITVDAAAPGAFLAFSGGLNQPDGFAARCKLDLPVLLAVVQPFIPPAIPDLAGNIELLLKAKADEKRDLHATLTINGAALSARGGAMKAKHAGPLDLKLQQQIATDHERQRVEFSGGTFVIPALLDAAWNASVTRPTSAKRTLDLNFGPMRVNLARMFSIVSPLLPSGSPVKEIAGEVLVSSVRLKLNGPENNGDLAVSCLGIKLPRLRVMLKNDELAATDIELLVDKVASPLVAWSPSRLTADLLWSVKNATLAGAKPLSIQGARGSSRVDFSELDLKSASPRKIAASATITQSFDLDRVSSGTRFIVGKTHGQLRLLATAARNGVIEANLPEFSITAASLQGIHDGKLLGPLPLSASLAATALRLPEAKGARATLQRAAVKISAGDAIQVVTEAALSATTASASGTARLDLRHTLPLFTAFIPSGLKADGVVTAAWNLAAPLRETTLAAGKNPLRTASSGMSLFDKLEISLKLDTISATVPSAKGAITVSGLRSSPDLRIVSTNKGESARLEGGLLFSGLSGFSATAGKLPSQHGSLSFNGRLTNWRDFRLNEELRIDPLALVQEAELNISRIDSLLDEKQPFNMATVLKRLDATLLATVDGAFSRNLKQQLPGFDLSGSISSSVRVDLTAGRELALRGSLKTRDFGVQLANGTEIEGMRSDVAIDRVYSLAAASRREDWTPLSAALVRPPAVRLPNPGASEIVKRIHDDLRGDLRGARTFSIRRVTAKASGVRQVLTALEGDLLLNREKAGLTFFQAEMQGGTILVRSVFDLKPLIPVITASSSFSNLDMTYLLPDSVKRQPTDADAEITGELSLTAPVTPEQRELFEQLRLALNIRKIGSNTLERALFSLDPHERNEQLVAQRKMLRLGNLKGLRAYAVDGAFSLEGEAQIKGIAVDLPKVERLRISELPQRQELVKNRDAIMALRSFLDLLRADTLVVGPKGELSLKRRTYEQ